MCYLFTALLAGLIIVMLTALVMSGFHGWRSIRIYRGVTQRRAIDSSNLQLAPPLPLQASIATLTALGFRRLGETQTKMPFAASLGTTWVFIDPEGTTHAEVIRGEPAMLCFSTMYDDMAVVETGHPFGEQIETPDFRSHTITTSIEDAYRYHQCQIAEFGAAHSTPRPIRDMTDFLREGEIYRVRYARHKMRRLYWINMVHLATFGYAVVVLAMMLLRDPYPVLSYEWLWKLFWLLIPASVVSAIALLFASWRTRRNSEG